jgi:heptosyltransferase-2/heptosyltransferase-3
MATSETPPPTEPAQGRPLVVRFGAIGDMILLTALVRGLAAREGRRCDLVVSSGASPKVLAGLDEVGDVFTLPSRRTPYWLAPEQRRLVQWLRRRGPSPTWVVEDMEKVEWLLERGGVGGEWRVSMFDVPRGDLEHAVHHLYRMLATRPAAAAPASDDHPPRPAPYLAVSDAELADCDAWIASRGWTGRPLVLLQTQSRRRFRGRWPDERWGRVAAAVLARLPESRAVLIGAPAEEAALTALAAAVGDARVEVAATDLPLRRLFALLTRAHSCVSLDTGPAHAAAVLGCPLVVLVGSADPRRNHPVPIASPLRLVTAWPEERWPPTGDAWVASHRPEQVPEEPLVAAWEEVTELGRGAGASFAYRHGTGAAPSAGGAEGARAAATRSAGDPAPRGEREPAP